MKILHVTPSYEPAWHLGGVVRSVSQLCQGLSQLGHEVTVFTTDSGKHFRMTVPVNELVQVSGVKVYYFKTKLSFRYAYSPALNKACQSWMQGFDIIHITSFWCYPGLVAVKGALLNRIPYLVSVRGTLRRAALNHKFFKKWLYFKAVEKKNISRAAAIHYTTQMERELDTFHRFNAPSFIVPNGFDIQELNGMKTPQEAKKSLKISPKRLVITFLGRLHEVKAIDFLIKAVSDNHLREKKWQLLIAGPDDGAEEHLKRLITNLDLDKQIHFLGRISPKERKTILAASDIFALVSKDENFGNAAVEAMLAGVPLLLSENVGICQEVLADGAGLVVPLQVEAITQTLRQMLSDPEKLQAMGKAAAVAARRRYDSNIVAQQMATAYEDILRGRRSPGLSWSDS